MVADSFGTVEGTREIGLDDLVPIIDGAIKDTAVSSAASVGDEGINLDAKASQRSGPSSVPLANLPCQSP